jgi:hypothetical protein
MFRWRWRRRRWPRLILVLATLAAVSMLVTLSVGTARLFVSCAAPAINPTQSEANSPALSARVVSQLAATVRAVDALLSAHECKHVLAFGSLIGLLRNGGHLPFDDDVDFMLLSASHVDAARLKAALDHAPLHRLAWRQRSWGYQFAKVHNEQKQDLDESDWLVDLFVLRPHSRNGERFVAESARMAHCFARADELFPSIDRAFAFKAANVVLTLPAPRAGVALVRRCYGEGVLEHEVQYNHAAERSAGDFWSVFVRRARRRMRKLARRVAMCDSETG